MQAEPYIAPPSALLALTEAHRTFIEIISLRLSRNVLRNAPPLAARTIDPDFQTLETVLAESDIVTLHLPLVKEKPWPTELLADYCFFEQLKPGTIFINASRGSVCDYDARKHHVTDVGQDRQGAWIES